MNVCRTYNEEGKKDNSFILFYLIANKEGKLHGFSFIGFFNTAIYHGHWENGKETKYKLGNYVILQTDTDCCSFKIYELFI